MEQPNGNSLLWIFCYQLFWKQRMYCLVIKLHLIVHTVCWGFELQLEIICPIKKKRISVERTGSSSKPSKTVKFWAEIRGWTYLITVKFEIFWTLKFKKILVSLVNSGRMQFSSRHFVQLDIDQLIHVRSFSLKYFKVQNYKN